MDIALHLHHHNLQIQSIHQAEVHDLQVVAVRGLVKNVILTTTIVVAPIIVIQESKNVSKMRTKVVNVNILPVCQ